VRCNVWSEAVMVSKSDDEDSQPSLVTRSSALVSSYPDQEVVQEEAHNKIPSGWNVSWSLG
jgi:hypothetical protein